MTEKNVIRFCIELSKQILSFFRWNNKEIDRMIKCELRH